VIQCRRIRLRQVWCIAWDRSTRRR
jgi:hypothetical protein